jgi:hypothetical protein
MPVWLGKYSDSMLAFNAGSPSWNPERLFFELLDEKRSSDAAMGWGGKGARSGPFLRVNKPKKPTGRRAWARSAAQTHQHCLWTRNTVAVGASGPACATTVAASPAQRPASPAVSEQHQPH